jgi:hypothetical protein
MSAVNIAFALVTYGPVWAPAYTSHLRVVAKAARHFAVESLGQFGAVGCSDRLPIDVAENTAAQTMLDTDCTHLFLTENDMILPDDTLLQLLAVDQPVVSGLYFLRNGDGVPCLYRRVQPGSSPWSQSPVTAFPTERPFRIDGCVGVGCLLVQRQVFETLAKPWFRLVAGEHGSDIYFSGRCREAGIPIWVEPRVRCGQIEYKVHEFADYEARVAREPGYLASGVVLGEADPASAFFGEGTA